MTTPVVTLNPLADERWPRFVARHPGASIFHSRGWLAALQRTYGYEPVAYVTTDASGELTNGLVACTVQSHLTGRRRVSLSFSDHCEPLVAEATACTALAAALASDVTAGGMKYAEVRPLTGGHAPALAAAGYAPGERFFFHQIDLAPDLAELQARFHKTAVVQMIRRAEREGLTYETGLSDALLQSFFELQVTTRRMHRVPPQPRAWFGNLCTCLGDAVLISVARHQGRPVAAMLTAHFQGTHYVKYASSDPVASKLGGTQLLWWKALEAAKLAGARRFDMGRSDAENPGLATFKDRWGAERSEIVYYRHPDPGPAQSGGGGDRKIVQTAIAALPRSWFIAAGRLLYRHMG